MVWIMCNISVLKYLIADTYCIVFAHIHLIILVNKREEKVFGVSRNITCERDFCCLKITKIMKDAAVINGGRDG